MSDSCDLVARQVHVYLIWGQQGSGEGCAPIDRKAWTSDLDPPVGERRYTFVLKYTSMSDCKCVRKTEAVREGERPKSYYTGRAHLRVHAACGYVMQWVVQGASLHLISSIC